MWRRISVFMRKHFITYFVFWLTKNKQIKNKAQNNLFFCFSINCLFYLLWFCYKVIWFWNKVAGPGKLCAFFRPFSNSLVCVVNTFTVFLWWYLVFLYFGVDLLVKNERSKQIQTNQAEKCDHITTSDRTCCTCLTEKHLGATLAQD